MYKASRVIISSRGFINHHRGKSEQTFFIFTILPQRFKDLPFELTQTQSSFNRYKLYLNYSKIFQPDLNRKIAT
jgi:hypothetical protein